MRPTVFDRLRESLSRTYRLERELGAGGMATVFLAADLKHGRQVAIKVLDPALSALLGPDRFLREIEFAARLTHPHILPLFDSGSADGLLYYVMPYLEGETLRDRLRREGQLPLEDVIAITRQVADALAHAHSLGIVHRDIKPENILFEAGHAVVADFGIARAVGAAADDRLTETGLAVGTPAYMSPEQADSRREPDGRSDLYSLACVTYEMLAGEPPFGGGAAQAILARKSLDPVPSIRTVRETVVPALEAVVLKALAKAPADRFASTTLFAEALAAATTPAQPSRPRLPGARTVALLTALGAILLGTWWGVKAFALRPPRIERLAVLPLANLTGDTTQQWFVDGMHDAMIAELTRIRELTVRPRTSVLRYRSSETDVPKIAQELGVDGIVEGSVFKAGESVRINVQLIAGATQQGLWSHTYDGTMADVLDLHRRVAREIAAAIRVALSPEDRRRLATARTIDPEAYEAFLRGRHEMASLSQAGLQRAIGFFERSLTFDSSFAQPYVGIADAYRWRGAWWGDLLPIEAFPVARTAVEKALAIDSTLAEAYSILGGIRFQFYWDWAGADAAFKKAMELNPNSPEVLGQYANFLRAMGRREEALVLIERSAALDSLSGPWAEVALHYFALGRESEGRSALAQGLARDPSAPPNLLVLGLQHMLDGRHDEAVAATIASGFPAIAANMYVTAGRPVEARRLLREIEQSEKPDPLWTAIAYANLRDTVSAVRWLERGYRQRSAMMVWVKESMDSVQERRYRMPMLVSLRSHPRVKTIVERLAFP